MLHLADLAPPKICMLYTTPIVSTPSPLSHIKVLLASFNFYIFYKLFEDVIMSVAIAYSNVKLISTPETDRALSQWLSFSCFFLYAIPLNCLFIVYFFHLSLKYNLSSAIKTQGQS